MPLYAGVALAIPPLVELCASLGASAGVDEIILEDGDFKKHDLPLSDIHYFVPVESNRHSYLIESLPSITVNGDANADNGFNRIQSNLYSTSKMLKGAVHQFMNILP